RFFFQAEDGIRDLIVTGVQTCALPISPLRAPCRAPRRRSERGSAVQRARGACATPRRISPPTPAAYRERAGLEGTLDSPRARAEIGRASCRERGWNTGGWATKHKTKTD